MSRRRRDQEPVARRRSTWVEPEAEHPSDAVPKRRSRHGEAPAASEPRAKNPSPSAPAGGGTGDGGSAEAMATPIAKRRRLRSFIAGSSALACVGALVAGTLLPVANPATADSFAAAMPQQVISTGGTTEDPAVLDALSAMPTAVAIPEIQTNGGTVSVTGLSDTALRYPFDQEVPLTDGFGYRSAPVAGFHDAQDMGAAGGTPVRIIGDGVITEAGWASDGCGFSLKVQHQVAGQAVSSRYCHMQDNSHAWQVGQTVQSGDQAGLVGTTGLSFGNHLHLALRVEDEPIDPLPFIAANSK